MNLIADNIPRTTRLHKSGGPKAPRHHDVISRDKDRAQIERDILEFHAKGGTTENILIGVSGIKDKKGKKLQQSMSSGITKANQARRAKLLPVKC